MTDLSDISATSEAAGDRDSSAGRFLGQEDFLPLAVRGFGDQWNSYVQSMAWFEGRLYCGTARATSCVTNARKVGRPQLDPWPIRCPEKDYSSHIDLRAQIWRFDPAAAEWQNVYLSPLTKTKDGKDFPRDMSYRGMAVLQSGSDAKPTLYVNTYGSAARGINAVILRSNDGTTFEPATSDGLGLQDIASYRTLKLFNGRVYTTAVGHASGFYNVSRFPVVFECADLASQEWKPVSEPGFGNPNNIVVFEMEVFNGYLYAGTGNIVSGFELWKTDAEGMPPYKWKRVLHTGAYRGSYNQGTAAMCVFDGALYISACIQDGGYDRVNRIGPGAPELLRVNADDSWDMVVGAPRLTPEGVKEPTSGYNPGFNDLTNGYFWRMCEHRGRLYVSTFNWSINLPYINRGNLTETARRLLNELGDDEFIRNHGGFDLWSTEDGDNFDAVTVSGFENRFNCGARTLVSTPIGLAVGTVNPFGPEVAAKSGDELTYVPNPRGGVEVWLGDAELPADVRLMPVCGALEDQPATVEGWRLSPVGDALARRAYLVIPDAADTTLCEFDAAELRRRAALIDQEPLISDPVIEARGLFDLAAGGLENIPPQGPVLFLGNNPAAPMNIDGLLVTAHTIYTLDAIAQRRGRGAWTLVTPMYFDVAGRSSYIAEMLERMGFVPITEGNGTRLLQMGEAVLAYPEEQPSRPPYGLRTFSPTYLRMALAAAAPIVPVVFVGTHESHLLIEENGRQILVNKKQRMRATFRIAFLPPVDVRQRLGASPDEAALSGLCAEIREDMEGVIRAETEHRPLIGLVQHLQRRHLKLRVGEPQTSADAAEFGDKI